MEPRPGDMVLGTPHRSNSPNPPEDIPSPRPFDLVLGFTPSTYQKAIFEWLAEGQGSCVVSAVPGSGKTTTLIKGANYIPKFLRSRFLAFNVWMLRDEIQGKCQRMRCDFIASSK